MATWSSDHEDCGDDGADEDGGSAQAADAASAAGLRWRGILGSFGLRADDDMR